MLIVSEALDILALLTKGVYQPGGRAVLSNPSSVWAAQFTKGKELLVQMPVIMSDSDNGSMTG